MKIIVNSCALLLCSLLVQGVRFLGDDKSSEADPKATPAKDGKDPKKDAGGKPLEGAAHTDNFQDEIVDQADPEFEMVSGGDGCISWEDMKKPLEQQFEEIHGEHEKAGTLDEATEREEECIRNDMLADLRMMFEYADALEKEDGCVNKTEFKDAAEMEGPPPGFEKKKTEEMAENGEGRCGMDMPNGTKKGSPEAKAAAEAEFAKQMQAEEHAEFRAMDTNNDSRISQQEAYTYASEGMPQADVTSTDMDGMFKDADKNGDGFITFEEFTSAGEAIEGDGNEMQTAQPMSLKIFSSKKWTLRMGVQRRLLAHDPPLRMLSNMISLLLSNMAGLD